MVKLALLSYNVGGKPADPTLGSARLRLARILEVVDALRPDVVAFQEVRAGLSAGLSAGLWARDYGIASASADWASSPEPIYYSRRRLRFHDAGRRPLGASTYRHLRVPARPRFVNWADLSGDGLAFRVCNFHLVGSAYKSAAADHVIAQPGFQRAFLLGDFNALPQQAVHQRLTGNGWLDAAECALQRDPGPTIHRYGAAKHRRVDWILAPRGSQVLRYVVHRRPRVLDEPSDHYPVAAWVDHAPPEPAAQALLDLLAKARAARRPSGLA